MHYVTDVKYLNSYKLKIRFEDNEVKIIDLEPYLDGPVFKPLKDIDFFKKVELNKDIDTIFWPNDADFAPEFLYQIGQNE